MCTSDPHVHVGAVAAECRPEHGGNVNLVVKDVVGAGLCSSYHKSFSDTTAIFAVFVHNTFDAPLHFVPASLVESSCLWNNVGQGESSQFIIFGECMRAWKYVTFVICSIGFKINVDSLVIVDLLFIFSPHVIAVIFILKLQRGGQLAMYIQ